MLETQADTLISVLEEIAGRLERQDELLERIVDKLQSLDLSLDRIARGVQDLVGATEDLGRRR